MSTKPNYSAGEIVWHDLTVGDAGAVREFYAAVVGWEFTEQEMGGYKDFDMKSADGKVVAGICHARGPNAGIPPQWLMWVNVPDVAAAARRCEANGGKVMDGPRSMGPYTVCVIQDPAGAVLGLIQSHE